MREPLQVASTRNGTPGFSTSFQETPRPLVELGEMEDAEGAEPGNDPAGAAEHEIGAPDVAPPARDRDAAGNGLGVHEAFGARFRQKHGFESRRRHQEDFEIVCAVHCPCISGRRHLGKRRAKRREAQSLRL